MSAEDLIMALESKLEAIEVKILENDRAYAEYPKALDAKVFYRIALSQLFVEKQSLLKEARSLEAQLGKLYPLQDIKVSRFLAKTKTLEALEQAKAEKAKSLAMSERQAERKAQFIEKNAQEQRRKEHGIE